MVAKKGELRPAVTVVMPVYNVAAYVECSLRSVLAQTFEDFEVIVIDDQSPDNSMRLVKKIAATDERIKCVSQENRGLAGARNTGIRLARGEFIAFLDSDDFWHPMKLEKLMSIMEVNSKVGVSFTSSLFVNDEGESLARIQTPKVKSGYKASHIFCRNPIGNGSAPLIRANIFQQISFKGNNKLGRAADYLQFFDESLKQSEDIDCWTRIALLTGTDFELLDEPLTYYRVNNEGLSANVDAQFETWMFFIEKLRKSYPEFVDQNLPAAKAFQYRYLARRCITQARAAQALSLMLLAMRSAPLALMFEFKKTFATLAASTVMALLSADVQKKLLIKLGLNL